jgi:hypothetical protein
MRSKSYLKVERKNTGWYKYLQDVAADPYAYEVNVKTLVSRIALKNRLCPFRLEDL